MGKYATSWTAPAVMLLLSIMNLGAWADGVCTARAPTAVEKKMYGDAYALFVRAAPLAPDGWQATDSPRTGTLPLLCVESGNAPIREADTSTAPFISSAGVRNATTKPFRLTRSR